MCASHFLTDCRASRIIYITYIIYARARVFVCISCVRVCAFMRMYMSTCVRVVEVVVVVVSS